MSSTACFVIVSRDDSPIYESEVGTAPKKDEAAHLHQFILHASLDIIQDVVWNTNNMFLKLVDKFNDLLVSVYVTAGHIRLMLLHDSRNEDGIKNFFQEVHELYIKGPYSCEKVFVRTSPDVFVKTSTNAGIQSVFCIFPDYRCFECQLQKETKKLPSV